jgi:hypothetical protein
MRLQSHLLLFRTFILAVLLTAVGAFGQALPETTRSLGSEYIEGRLAKEWYYDIPASTSPLEWFQKLVLVLKSDLVVHPEDGAKTFVLLADAYHWIGHIYEDRGQLENAWEAHNKSYEAYLLSNLRYSPMINFLNGLEHAKHHINRLALQLHRQPIYGIKSVAQSQCCNQDLEEARLLYRAELELRLNRTHLPNSLHECRLLLQPL